ncbi:MAG: response regulator, partial [Nitrospirae bacterium]|nr:response regulator [Nitrospirota bacterium]
MQSNYKILIVEDILIEAEMLRHILALAGFDIIIAANGKEALELITSTKPSIIISDILMPIMDGYELCRRIKLDENTAHIPVILLTQLIEPHDIIKGLESKADSFISKPFEKEFLINKINTLIV